MQKAGSSEGRKDASKIQQSNKEAGVPKDMFSNRVESDSEFLLVGPDKYFKNKCKPLANKSRLFQGPCGVMWFFIGDRLAVRSGALDSDTYSGFLIQTQISEGPVKKDLVRGLGWLKGFECKSLGLGMFREYTGLE